jgi:hypothetical protein
MVPALGMQRQEDHEFETSLGYMFQKKENQNLKPVPPANSTQKNHKTKTTIKESFVSLYYYLS